MDFNSPRNQKIREQFVRQHVLACITDMAECLFEEGNYAYFDEWDNIHVQWCPQCGAANSVVYDPTVESADDIPEDCDPNEYAESHPYVCQECCTRFEKEPEDEMPDIYEYWIVDEFLGKLLKEKGEPVLERELGWIWGRTTTGQAIFLDEVIVEICYELNILEDELQAQ